MNRWWRLYLYALNCFTHSTRIYTILFCFFINNQLNVYVNVMIIFSSLSHWFLWSSYSLLLVGSIIIETFAVNQQTHIYNYTIFTMPGRTVITAICIRILCVGIIYTFTYDSRLNIIHQFKPTIFTLSLDTNCRNIIIIGVLHRI